MTGNEYRFLSCWICKQRLPSDLFYKNRARGTGFSSECKKCQDSKNKKWLNENRDLDRQYKRNFWRKRRVELLNAYGHRCACCGETERRFLTLEHKNLDGGLHRKISHSKIYEDVRRMGYPKDKYELLCMNCNFAKRYGDPCPHQIFVDTIIKRGVAI